MTSCGAIHFQKCVKLSGHIRRCFLWDVCGGEERSTLDINNSPSDKDCWREPRRLQIPMWMHDTQLTSTEASSQRLRYSPVCLDGPLLGSSGFTLIETCLFTAVKSYPMYCSGWLWWMTIRHVGHVLFSSRYFTKQLLQTTYTHTNTQLYLS